MNSQLNFNPGTIIGATPLFTTHNWQPANIDFKPTLESITEGFFLLDNHWMITYWNEEIANITGYASNVVLGRGLWNFFNNQGNLNLYLECRRAKQQNISVRFEEYYKALDTWMEVYAFPTETGLAVFVKNISEQKKAESLMKANNERYDLMMKATNDLVWDWNIINGEIYRNNAGVQRVYGHSNDENIRTNQQWLEYLHPQDKNKIDNQIANLISSENVSSFSFEYRFKREDGAYNFINDKAFIIRNELGIVVRMIGAARDITIEKKAAHAIEQSEERYKSFVQQSTEGIWRMELDVPVSVELPADEIINYCIEKGYLAECNDAFARMYGFEDASAIIGTPLSQLMPVEDPANIAYFKKFFTNGFNIQGEMSYEVDIYGNPLVFVNNLMGIVSDGKLLRAWGTQREITQQKLNEDLLLASEEQYRNLFNNNPCSIFICDYENLQIVQANDSALKLYGYTREEFMKLTATDTLEEEDKQGLVDLSQVIRHIDDYKNTKIWKQVCKSGEIVYVEIATQNIMYNGKICALAIGNNVTEKVKLEKSLNDEMKNKQKQITDAVITGQERERQQLGEELHDNINQILASTRLYIECALNDINPRKELLEQSRGQLDSAMAEIRKLSKSLLPPSLEKASLLQSLEDVANTMTSTQQVKITRAWQDFDESVLDDKLKLTIFRIVQEQLTNIQKHSKAKSASIQLRKEKNTVSLFIADDGVGFELTSKRSGVGLRNISSRAEVNNGVVKLNSAPGKGCTLLVRFKLTA